MRTFALLGLASLTLATVGCNGGTTNPVRDLAGADYTGVTLDLTGQIVDMSGGGGNDMAMAITATLHDIDTGMIPAMTPVTVPGVVVIGIANGAGHSKKTMKCEYEAYVQDPNGMAPDGIRLFTTGQVCTNVTSDAGVTTCKCPYPPNSGTPLDDFGTLGDVFTIVGKVDTFSPSTDMGLAPPQHEIDISAPQTKTASGMMVTPTVITDGTQFALNAAGYQMYESMLVTIKPAMPFTVSAQDKFGNFTGGGAQFGGQYDFIWGMKGAFPAVGSKWTSITGVATPAFGGAVAPRQMSDFVP